MSDVLAVSLNYKWVLWSPEVWHQARPEVKLPLGKTETSIAIFEDRVDGWFLAHARGLLAGGDAGYVVLQIALAQIEGLQQFREGQVSTGSAKDCFVRGLTRVFGFQPTDGPLLGKFYKAVRCGLFHNGFTQGLVVVGTSYAEAIAFRDQHIYVNPKLVLEKVDSDFREYVAALRNGSDATLISNFETMWGAHWSSSKQVLQYLDPSEGAG